MAKKINTITIIIFLAFWFLFAGVEEPIVNAVGRENIIGLAIVILIIFWSTTKKQVGGLIK